MQKILVANRGEIALRIMRTIKKMGISTVAVYSAADRDAPHVRFADEAVLLGQGPSSQSYLLQDKIVEIARKHAVDGIHPGYGFLSENAAFAQKVVDNGMIFIGPGPQAIKTMGSKLAAKEAVKKYDIPQVPGVDHAIDSVEEALQVARTIGFPVLIKASAGGGGKGMRIVHEAEAFEAQMERAISEAESAFGDGAVFIEKYVSKPRHIEIQIMADQHGNIIHLFERECSIQRRHQKVIEEAPSVVLTPALRAQMGAAAVDVARACNYVGAGTVEFLLDANHDYFFLEMNTRLQVEHPVTELITGLDLVEEQIKIARGLPLDIQQEDMQIQGHALELRVYAEDPYQNFLPSVGRLEVYQRPEGANVRLDDGYEAGMEIPIFYDPMIAKLITFGETREVAIKYMLEAIANYRIEGVATTLPFGTFVCRHPAFITGDFDTHFVQHHFQPEFIQEDQEKEAFIAAQLGARLMNTYASKLNLPNKASRQWLEQRRP